MNAALKEFAQKGYQHASTNEIVKGAEISKGLIFHYFKNKKGLFLFLYDYSLAKVSETIYSKINWDEKDMLIRYKETALLKMDLFMKYPDLFNFIKTAYSESSSEVRNEVENKNKQLLLNSYERVFKDVDLSKFREDIDPIRAIQIIIFSMEGFAAESQEKMKTLNLKDPYFEEIINELDSYIDLFRMTFYR